MHVYRQSLRKQPKATTLPWPNVSGFSLFAFDLPLPDIDPLAAAAHLKPWRFYWERPNQREAFAGFGVAAQVHSLAGVGVPGAVHWAARRRPSFGPWFGGLGFSAGPDKQWSGFPATRWVIPEVLL
jgi:hypothetical protein